MKRRFEGVCYDGPLEGESHTYDVPIFRIAVLPRVYFRSSRKLQRELKLYRDVRYHWSYSLRKWCVDFR